MKKHSEHWEKVLAMLVFRVGIVVYAWILNFSASGWEFYIWVVVFYI